MKRALKLSPIQASNDLNLRFLVTGRTNFQENSIDIRTGTQNAKRAAVAPANDYALLVDFLFLSRRVPESKRRRLDVERPSCRPVDFKICNLLENAIISLQR